MSLDGRNDANRAPKTEYGHVWDADHNVTWEKMENCKMKFVMGLECKKDSLIHSAGH